MTSHKISMFGAMLCLLGVGFSDTANGQITTNPPLSSGMNFQVQSGGATASQNLMITSSHDPTTLVVTTPGGANWLKVAGNPAGSMFFPNSPATLTVTVDTTGLTTGSTYTANILIAVNNLPATQVSFPVSLTVGTPSLLSANPANLTFSAVQGASSGSPNSTAVTVTSNGPALNYNVSAQTQSGSGNWLLLSNTQNISTSSSVAGFSVSVNASQLSVGNYNGTITLQSISTGDSLTIPVTLSVTTGAALNVTGTLNSFIFQSGSGAGSFSPQTQTLMISTSSGTLNYQVVATPVSGPTLTANWLLVSPNGGLATTTAQPISVSLSSFANLTGLTPGTYVVNIAISPTGGGGNTTTVPVTLVVSNNALLNVNNRALTFSLPFGSTSPQTQTLQVSSSNGSNIPYTVVSNQSWLSASPANGTTAVNSVLNVTVNASGLNVSTTPYVGTLTISPNNSDIGLYNIPITVSLTVTAASSQIFAGPDQLLFSYQSTPQTLPGVQLVKLTSPATLAFSVSTTTMAASNCPASNWLMATPNQNFTPATLTVSVAAAGMTAGFCSGTVIVTYNNGVTPNTSVNIPVVVDIAPTPLLTVTPDPGFGVVTATYGSNASLSSRISINSTDGSPLGFSAYASTPGAPVSWLYLASSTGTTQQYLQVNIQPSGLPVGVYNGSITIHATNSANLPSGDLTIPVVLTVSTNTTVSVSPTSLSFTQAQGATPPASQPITLTAAGGSTSFTASVTPVTGGNWLQITPLSGTAGTTASNITASVLQNTLSPGTYTSNITLVFLNSATPNATIPVSLVVTAAQAVVASATTLAFNYQLGSAAPATQTLNVTSTGGPVAVSVGTTSTPAWLSVTPATGSTGAAGAPLVLTVSVVPGALTTAGTFNGTITLTPAGQAAITIPVTVTVTGVQVPQPTSISNSANGSFGAISPGELVTIKGIGIGPSTSATFTVGAGNTVSNILSGVQVLFDGIPGTPTYVSSTQINVIVPYEIAGRATTNVVVVYQQQQAAAIPQNVARQAPGIYTFSATGAGQAAALNQNYSFNGPSAGLVIGGQNISTTPAAQGSVIAVYMTGGGQTSPASTTGTITPTPTTTTPLYNIPGKVTATINGVNATVLFAGAAPGLVTGVIQVNLQVPVGVTGSGLPIAITINGTTTLAGPTVSVQ